MALGIFEVIQIIVAVVSVVMAVQAKKAAKSKIDDRAGMQVTRFGTDEQIPVAIGEEELAPIIVYQATREDPDEDPVNEYWYGVLVWCVGEIEDMQQIYFDDNKISEYGFYQTNLDPNSDKDYATTRKDRISTFYGKDNKVNVPNWFINSSSKLSAPDALEQCEFRGLCVSFVRLKMDKEFKNYPQGVPDFKAFGRWMKIYDFVTNSSNKTSQNPYSILNWYLRNDQVGKGDTNLDTADMRDKALLCDEEVTLPGGEIKKLKEINVILPTENKIFDNISEILDDIDARPVAGENGLRFEFGRPRDPVMHFDSGEFKNLSVESLDNNDVYHQVIIRFRDETNRYKVSEAVYPPTDSEEYNDTLFNVLDGVPNPHEEEAFCITSYYHALQRAEMIYRANLEGLNGGGTLGLRGFYLDETDVITITDEGNGWDAKPFEVTKISSEGIQVKIEFVEYQPSLYPWSNMDERQDYEDTNLKNPFDIADIGNLRFEPELNDPTTVGYLVWDRPTTFVTHYKVIVKNLDTNVEVINDTTKQVKYRLPLMELAEYRASVTGVNEITEGEPVTLTFDLDLPPVPLVDVTPENFGMRIRPYLDDRTPIGLLYELYLSPTSNFSNATYYGLSPVFNISGLPPATTFWYWVRSVNSIGKSEFATGYATTTFDTSVLSEFMGQVTLPGLPDTLLDTVNDFYNRHDLWDQRTNQLGQNFQTLDQELTEVSEDVGINKANILGLRQDMGDKSVEAQITDFKNIQIGYTDAQGNWHEGAAFAEAFENVRIQDNTGDYVSVYQYFSALETEVGKIGEIQLAVDAGGKVTGMFVRGSSTQSDVIIASDKFRLTDTNGETRLGVNNQTGELEFIGSGKFFGTLFSPRYYMISGNMMKVEDPGGIGPDNLTVWQGPVILSGGEPRYNELRRNNAYYSVNASGVARYRKLEIYNDDGEKVFDANGKIDGAYIKNASVNTLQIQGNAVTVPRYVETSEVEGPYKMIVMDEWVDWGANIDATMMVSIALHARRIGDVSGTYDKLDVILSILDEGNQLVTRAVFNGVDADQDGDAGTVTHICPIVGAGEVKRKFARIMITAEPTVLDQEYSYRAIGFLNCVKR